MLFVLISLIWTDLIAQNEKLPIIDMHLHAFPANALGPPPLPACNGTINFPPVQFEEGLTGQLYVALELCIKFIKFRHRRTGPVDQGWAFFSW